MIPRGTALRRGLALGALTAGLWLATGLAAAALAQPAAVPNAWLRPHADGANTGFADVVTAPALQPVNRVTGLGTIAPGAGPVIGPDGTVYVGSQQGTLFAFHPDGSKSWSGQLPKGQKILASPAVGADGSVYVVGVRTYQSEKPAGTHYASELHKFQGGVWQWHTPLPQDGPAPPPANAGHGFASAAPNIWSSGSVEIVVVPAVYPNALTTGRDVRLAAFATNGVLVGDAAVSSFVPTVTGGNDQGTWKNLLCLLPPYIACIPQHNFQGSGEALPPGPGDLPAGLAMPFPTVAIATPAGGGAPWILVADQMHDVVGFSFALGSGLKERMRVHAEDQSMLSTPLALPDGRIAIGTGSGLMLVPVQATKKLTDLPGLGIRRTMIGGIGGVAATPSRSPDGGLFALALGGTLAVVNGKTVASTIPLKAASIAAPAISRTHIFVATTLALRSFDAATLAEVAKVDWQGGGLSSPAIGPNGHVYAIAGNALYVFPPPMTLAASAAPGTSPATGGGAASPEPGGPAQPQMALKVFRPPLTAGGKRLYACRDFDGHGCGAPVAAAFCRQQGFAKADALDTSTEKVKAETLDGQLCAKRKCKVFTRITCSQ